MPKFSYRAKKGPEEIVNGIIEAGTSQEALSKLTNMGYVPVRISEYTEAAGKKPLRLSLFKRIRPRDLTMVTSQLASLVRAKVNLLEAVKILSEQTESPELQGILFHITEELEGGKGLSEALNAYPDVFPPLYINMVRSGESGGVLEESLARLADFREKEEELKAKIGSALAYPAFIVLVGILTVLALLIFAMPRLTSLFSELGQTLPLPTRMLVFLTESMKTYWYWLIIIIVLLILALRGTIQRKSLAGDAVKLRLPLLGMLIKKTELARFSRTFKVLLANGIPVFQAVEIAALTVNNQVFRIELERVREDIIGGMQLGESLKKSKLFPRFVTNMLAIGEKGGNLEDTLEEVANFYEREVDRTTKIMTSLIEPVIILIMGLVVGFIVFAMLLPIFQINVGLG